jgi:hypothetical protein
MKKLSVLFFLTTALNLQGMEGVQGNQIAAPQPAAQIIVARNTDEFLASIDNEHNSQVRYFTDKYFPESVILKFGEKAVTPEQANAIRQSLIQDLSLGNKVNEQRSCNLTPTIKTALENGYIQQYHKELAKHPLIAPEIKEKKRKLQEKTTKWNDHMEKQKVTKDFFIEEEFSYRKLLPGSAWIKYPFLVGLSVLFSNHIKYAFWGAVKHAPTIWAKYFARAAANPPAN